MIRAHGALAAADGRDQRELVAGRERRVAVGVLAVHRHDHRQLRRERAQLLDRVLHARALRQLDRELRGARALAELREEADGDLHRSGMLRRRMWRLKLLAARARRRLAGPQPDREDVVRRHAAGKTFCDVGCMWKVNGRIAFVAEEAGATAVTGRRRDGRRRPSSEAEHERRVVERPLRARRPARPRDGRRRRPARGRLVQRRPLPRAQSGADARSACASSPPSS